MFDGRGGRRLGAGAKRPRRRIAPASASGDVRSRARTAARLYDELAPLARGQGTLIPATELEFRVLCDLAMTERRLAAALARKRPIDDRWFKLQKTHDGVMRRLEVKLRSFLLAPMGEPLAPPASAKVPTPLELLKAQRHAVGR